MTDKIERAADGLRRWLSGEYRYTEDRGLPPDGSPTINDDIRAILDDRDAARAELAALKARVVEVLEPFAKAFEESIQSLSPKPVAWRVRRKGREDWSFTDYLNPGTDFDVWEVEPLGVLPASRGGIITLGHLRAARALRNEIKGEGK